MRNLLAFLAALVLTLGCIGWYLDWYRIRSTPVEGGHKSVTVEFDTKKISNDLLKAEQKVQEKLAEKAKATGEAESGKKPLDTPPPAGLDVIE